MSFREISIDSWIRKSQYHFFKDYDNPYFNITSNVDVSALKLFCDSNNLSFFISSIYCSLKACNETEPFRTRFKKAEDNLMKSQNRDELTIDIDHLNLAQRQEKYPRATN